MVRAPPLPPPTPALGGAPAAAAAAAAARDVGWWGRPTSTIDWCEGNYEVTRYVAEWWNAASSLLISLCGAAAVVVVGLGSTAFHATLLFPMQLLDELPMIYAMCVWWYVWFELHSLRPRRWLAPALAAGAAAVTVAHAVCGFVAAPAAGPRPDRRAMPPAAPRPRRSGAAALSLFCAFAGGAAAAEWQLHTAGGATVCDRASALGIGGGVVWLNGTRRFRRAEAI
eukprot:gene1250-4664_t